MSRAIAISIALIVITVSAPAQQQPKVDCSAFQRNADGSWKTLKSTTVSSGGGSKMSFDVSMTFGRGAVSLDGVDLVTLLEQHCQQS